MYAFVARLLIFSRPNEGGFLGDLAEDFSVVFSARIRAFSLSLFLFGRRLNRLHSFVREEEVRGRKRPAQSARKRERERQREEDVIFSSEGRSKSQPQSESYEKKKQHLETTRETLRWCERWVMTSFIISSQKKKNRNQSVPTAPVSTGTRSCTRTRRDICTGTN